MYRTKYLKRKCNNCWIKIWCLFEDNLPFPSNYNGRRRGGGFWPSDMTGSLFNTGGFLGTATKKLQCTVIEFNI